MKKYKSIIDRKWQKHEKKVFLAKAKSSVVEVYISNTLTESSISPDEFVLIDNILKEYSGMKVAIKNPNIWYIKNMLILEKKCK